MTTTQTTTIDSTNLDKYTKDVLVGYAVERGIFPSKKKALATPKAEIITTIEKWCAPAAFAPSEPTPEPAPVEASSEPVEALSPLAAATFAPKPRTGLTGAQKAAKRKRNKASHKRELRNRCYH